MFTILYCSVTATVHSSSPFPWPRLRVRVVITPALSISPLVRASAQEPLTFLHTHPRTLFLQVPGQEGTWPHAGEVLGGKHVKLVALHAAHDLSLAAFDQIGTERDLHQGETQLVPPVLPARQILEDEKGRQAGIFHGGRWHLRVGAHEGGGDQRAHQPAGDAVTLGWIGDGRDVRRAGRRIAGG